jgi:hypothetical protein
MALARDLHEPLAVEEEVDGLLAMPAGQDDRARSERVDRPHELLGARLLPRLGEHPPLRDVGGHDRRAREEEHSERLLGFLVQEPGAALRDHHRVEHHRRVGDEV